MLASNKNNQKHFFGVSFQHIVGIFLLCIILITLSFFVKKISFAINDAYNASDMLGQLDGSNNPVFTTSYENNTSYPNATGFFNPSGQALDPVNHRLFVTDTFNERVLVFNTDINNNPLDTIADNVIGQPDFVTRTASTTQNSLSGPTSLFYDASTTQLFVSDTGNNRVLIFNVSTLTNNMNASFVLGQPDFITSLAGTSQNKYSIPHDITYNTASSTLYVADSGNNRVLIFDMATTTNGMNASFVLGHSDFITSLSGTTQNRLSWPNGLSYDASSTRLFVTDSGNNRVLIFNVATTTDGMNASNVLGQPNFITNTFTTITQNTLFYPKGIVFDAPSERLFVADSFNSRVLIFDMATTTSNGMNASFVLGQADFATTTFQTTQHNLSYPSALAYDTFSKKLFVSDENNQRVLIFDTTTVVNNMDALAVLGQTDINNLPTFTSRDFGNMHPNNKGFNTPIGIAIDEQRHRLFVTDESNNRVLVFNLDTSNNLIDRIADNVIGQPNLSSNMGTTTQNGLLNPESLVYDASSSRLLVADTSNYRIMVFDVSTVTDGMNASFVLGQPDFVTNVATATQNGLSTVRGISYEPTTQKLFVADDNNHRVLIFDITNIANGMNASFVLGQPDFITKNANATQNGLNQPERVLYEPNYRRLYVADAWNNRVLVFDMATTTTNGMNASYVLGQSDFITSTSPSIPTQNTMDTPRGFAYDFTNNILFVAEYYGNRVTGFNVSSTTLTNGMSPSILIGEPDYITNTQLDQQNRTNGPKNLFYDNTNRKLYIAEARSNRVSIYNFITLTTDTLPHGTKQTLYNQPFTSTFSQGTTSYSIASGTLPLGISLSQSGVLSGSTTESGVFSFLVAAADNVFGNIFTHNKSLSLTIDAPLVATTTEVATTPIITSGGSYFVQAPATITTPTPSLPLAIINSQAQVSTSTEKTKEVKKEVPLIISKQQVETKAKKISPTVSQQKNTINKTKPTKVTITKEKPTQKSIIKKIVVPSEQVSSSTILSTSSSSSIPNEVENIPATTTVPEKIIVRDISNETKTGKITFKIKIRDTENTLRGFLGITPNYRGF